MKIDDSEIIYLTSLTTKERLLNILMVNYFLILIIIAIIAIMKLNMKLILMIMELK